MHSPSIVRQPPGAPSGSLRLAAGRTPVCTAVARREPAATPAPPGAFAPAPVSTVLTPDERLRVDAAGGGVYRALHRESLDDVLRDLRERRVAAVLVSLTRYDAHDLPCLTTMVREFPRVRAVALLTQLEGRTAHSALALGQSGVRTLIDARDATGWRELRRVLAPDGDDVARTALSALAEDLDGAPADCRRVFESLFAMPAHVTTVRKLCERLAVRPSTFMSRFFRARLPAPKRYLAFARLVRAARLLENTGLSIASVANQLEYSSPQSFGRHLRTLLRISAFEFRQRYDGDGMLQRFRAELVLPYRATLLAFTPLTAPPGWLTPPRPPRAAAPAPPSSPSAT